MNDQRFGQNQNSQTGTDTDGRSAEYADDLTVQDTTKAAIDSGSQGSTNGDISGETSPGAAMSGANLPSGGIGSGTSYEGTGSRIGGGTDWDGDRTTTGGVGNEPLAGGAWQGSTSRGEAHEMGDNTDGLGRDQTDRVTADETGTLIAADKVQGTAVYDGAGERLGTIDSLMLNKRSGKVAYAVMSFGGFLGIGERYHPLPWDKLTYDTEIGGYNIGVTQDELRAGPAYSRDEIDEFDRSDRRSGEVDDYYQRSALGGGITGATGVPIV